MSQPGEDSGVEIQKKTALENKWTASKARLYNIIGCIGTPDPSPCAASCILEQLDQAKKYMDSVFNEMVAILTPTEQDEILEDFNRQEKVYIEACSKLRNVKGERVSVVFPCLPKFDGKSFFTFFQSVVLFNSNEYGSATKENYLKQLTGSTTTDKWHRYFGEHKNITAWDAAREMLHMKRMPLTLLLDNFRRCIFLLSFTGHDRDWRLLVEKIICECLDSEAERSNIQKELTEVTRSLADF